MYVVAGGREGVRAFGSGVDAARWSIFDAPKFPVS